MESSHPSSSLPLPTLRPIERIDTETDANADVDVDVDINRDVGSDSSPLSLASQELPFLVTHWLSRYGCNSNNSSNNSNSNSDHDGTIHNGLNEGDEEKKAEAIRKIRRATSELASAFADLGEFGYRLAVSLR